jgi:spore coat polysaccharide biosynthesis predicted glycosyltransferase SpsG
MQALKRIEVLKLEVRLIVGAANRHLDALKAELPALCERHEAEILINPPHLSGHMAWSDVTITAAGSSCWELCCLGVPQLMLVTADNQRLMPAFFAGNRIAEVFGELVDSRTEELAHRLTDLLLDVQKRRLLSHAAKRVVDGAGASRVVDFMLSYP